MNTNLIRSYAAKNQIKHSEIAPLTRRQDPLDVQAGAHIKDQEEIDLYVDKAVGTVYKVGSIGRFEKFKRDALASKHAARQGIPVAKPLAEPELIAGKALFATKYIKHDPQHTPDPARAGSLLAKLHRIKITKSELPPVTSQLPDFVRYALNRRDLSGKIRAAICSRCLPCISEVTKDMQSSESFIHGDLHLGNILPAENGPALIDFECAGRGSPLWDLAVIVQSSTRFGLDKRWSEAFLNSWKQYHNYHQKLLDRYVEWRYWYGALSMIKRVDEGGGDREELAVRMKWVLDPNDQSSWRRC